MCASRNPNTAAPRRLCDDRRLRSSARHVTEPESDAGDLAYLRWAPVTFDPDSPFARLGLDPAPAAQNSQVPGDQPLTRRQARERDAAASAPLQAPEYVAIRTEAPAPTAAQDFPTRSASRTPASRDGKPSASKPAATSKRAGKAATAPRGRKVKVKFTKAKRPKSSFGSKFLSLGALLGAAALLVGMSVPANAFIDTFHADAGTTAVPVDGQSMKVSADVAGATTARDGFEVISYAELLRLKYSGLSYAYTATTGAVRWPFPYPVPITDGFGYREYNEFHNGVDFVPGAGTPIYAIADGIVTTATELQWSFGNHVIIQHNLGGVNVESLYAHMQTGSSPLTVGQEVKVGDFIGLVGDTGRAYGAHLHFELHIDGVPVDPYAWLQANAVN
jgi:murein DD-endopeptidase MepM/ murein hydrolase activator NlpD